MIFKKEDIINYDSESKLGEIAQDTIPVVVCCLQDATSKGKIDWKETYTYYKGVAQSGVEIILYKYAPVYLSIYLNEKVGVVNCKPGDVDILKPLECVIVEQLKQKDSPIKLVEELNRVFEKEF